jgi:4-amino-4-deoxy-L-arabinose transferase-like glycosyltransferase
MKLANKGILVDLIFFDLILVLFLLFLGWLIFFRNLGGYSLRVWDEGRNAVNALEMSQNHNFLVTYFNGSPDMWNTKPPFLIWLINLSFKIFGVNELAVRIPSAVSAILVVLIIYFGLKKIAKNRLVGFLGSLIILSSMGFPDWHIGRTGDYDALLTLMIFLASLFFWQYLELKQNKKFIFLSFMFFILAVLTKGIAGFFIVPGIIIYALVTGNFIKIIKDSNFWKALGLMVAVVGLYYGLREFYNNGYLKAVWQGEILRSTNLIDGQKSNFWYYWKYFAEFRFQKWIYFVPFSILSVFLTKDKKIKRWVIFGYLISLIYFLIISVSATKYLWYDAQLYPFMSMLVAIFIYLLIKKVPFILKIFPILILVFYMQRYIRTNIAYIARPDLEKENGCIKYGYVFRENVMGKDFVGVHDDFCTPFDFYLLRNGNKRKELNMLEINDKIFSCDGRTLGLINIKYKTELILKTDEGCIEEVILGYNDSI